VTDATGHLPYWKLEQLAEGGLSHVERTLAEKHLRQCARCAAEMQSARALLAALSALPQLDPSPSFADAVMSRVVVAPRAAPAAVAAPAEADRRWLPRARRGWMMLLALILVPLPVLAGLGTWMGGDPVSGMGALWGGVRGWARDVSWNLLSEGIEALIRTGLFQWGADTLASIPGPTAGGVPVLLLVLMAAVPASAWAMTRLLRAPTMTGMTHA
jgi:hypothetical protein